jgi:sec-independent protein translocase protein TatC
MVDERLDQESCDTSNERSGARMGFLEHLEELRARIIRSCLAIAGGMAVAFLFADRIADFVERPIVRALPPGTTLVFIRPTEALSFYFDLALLGGVVLAAPFVMYQVWRFIAPGLYSRERRIVIPFVALTCVSTITGALFSHYVLFPGMIAFLGTFGSPRMKFLPGVEETFGLYKTLLLGMIVVFQIPTLVFFLARMGLVSARFLWRHFKYAVLIVFVLAGVLTPSTDPWNQAVFAAPMIGLYLIGIVIAWIVAPRRKQGRHAEWPDLPVVIAVAIARAYLRRGFRSLAATTRSAA